MPTRALFAACCLALLFSSYGIAADVDVPVPALHDGGLAGGVPAGGVVADGVLADGGLAAGALAAPQAVAQGYGAYAPYQAYGYAPYAAGGYGYLPFAAGIYGDSLYSGQAGGWQPGGYQGRVGSPYYYSASGYGGSGYGGSGYAGYGGYGGQGGYAAPIMASPYAAYGGGLYDDHFGPGFYRNSEYGHYRFPYYSYRRPWYFPGPASYNRDTNLPW